MSPVHDPALNADSVHSEVQNEHSSDAAAYCEVATADVSDLNEKQRAKDDVDDWISWTEFIHLLDVHATDSMPALPRRLLPKYFHEYAIMEYEQERKWEVRRCVSRCSSRPHFSFKWPA